MKPQNLPEKLIWYYILGIYPIYYIGGLYLFAPLLAIFLTLYLAVQWWRQTDETPLEEKIQISMPAWVWVGCMSVVAIAAIIGSLNYDLPLSKLLSTLMNRWLRTWALLALFPLVGHLNIRPQLIYRAACIFCVQSLVIVPIFGICFFLFNSYEYSFLSPLSKFGGGELYYTVKVFGAALDVSEKRLQMIAPWPPALGLFASIFFCLCIQEKNKLLCFLGVLGAAILSISSVSRAAIVCLPLIPISIWTLERYSKLWIRFLLSAILFISAIFSSNIQNLVDEFSSKLREYRSGSSKARDNITQLALDAWQNEAPIWGHGSVSDNGPASVGRRGLGSHNTWIGILYANGLVGALPLGIAFIWSFFDLLLKLGTHKHAVAGLSILGVLMVFSFIDNIDTLAYLYWPGLVILGIAFKEDAYSIKGSKLNIYAH